MAAGDREYREFHRGNPADPTPECDRCGTASAQVVVDVPTLRVICVDCLSVVEKRCLDLGVSAFGPEPA